MKERRTFENRPGRISRKQRKNPGTGWKRGILVFALFALAGGFGLPGGATAHPEFNADSAFAFLTAQTDFGPRNPGSEGHRACLQYLVRQLGKYTDLVETQPFMHYDADRGITVTMSNIIARFRPELTRRILLCAHWDTRPVADMDSPENAHKPILGANDGASGVAVLLEMARQFALHPPPVGIDIVFFDGEDYGKRGDLQNYFLGSRYFVKNNNRFFPEYAILLDMVGDAYLQLPIEGYSQQYAPEVVQKIWDLAQALGVYQFIPEVNGYISDDHVILNEGGIKAVDIIDLAYPDETNRYWHTLQDTPDKCSPRSLRAVGKVLMELIYVVER